MPRRVDSEDGRDKNIQAAKGTNTDKQMQKLINNTHADNNDADKVEDKESRFIVSFKEQIKHMITNQFEPKELLAFSQLRTLNQKELIHSLEQNDKLGIVIKDKIQVAMINMDNYEMLVEAVHEYSRLLEWLEEQELFKKLESRLKNPVLEELPEGKSLWEWAGLEAKG